MGKKAAQQLVCQQVGWMPARLAGWLAGSLAGWLAGSLARWLARWLAGHCCVFSHLVDRLH
jgi:fructose-specific phosphotransferase system IIC component